jgi:small subunit ribosomal protein S16
MPVKIRLQRKGRKARPYYHIVVADSRAPRDGKYIERLGFYNPITNPATIEINFDRALTWLQNGAQPTETASAILRYEGVLLKKHLMEGVKKGAFDEAKAEEKFQTWLKEKRNKIQAKIDNLSKSKDTDIDKRIEAEAKVSEKRAQAIAKRNAAALAKSKAAEAGDVAVEEEVAEEIAVEETPVAIEEVQEAPVAAAETTEEAEAQPEAEEATEAPAEEETKSEE